MSGLSSETLHRSFLRALVLACLAPLTSSTDAQVRRSTRPPAAVPSDTIGFIDAHVHLNDAPTQLALMNETGIGKAIAFWGRASSNDDMLAAAKAHPDRFIPFVSISPERAAYRQSWTQGDTALLATLDSALRSGRFAGIGEISVVHFPGEGFPEADFDPLSPMMRGIMTLAGQYRVPVMIHCEITHLEGFARLLREFPAVTVIWAHGGYTPYFLAERMLEAHPNLVYELSARTWSEHPRSPDYTIFRNETTVWSRWLGLVERNSQRFIVGTDAAQRGNDREKVARVRLFLSQLSPATREMVAKGNVERLLRR